jgi:hypothetical protein
LAGYDFGVKIGFPTELAGKTKNLCSDGAIVNRKLTKYPEELYPRSTPRKTRQQKSA